MTTLIDLPLEIAELIIGNMSFLDLPYFLQTCNQANTMFKATKVYPRFKLLSRPRLATLHANMGPFPEMGKYWTITAIVESFLDSQCIECGEDAYWFLWARLPAAKVCADCLLQRPKFWSIDVARGVKLYGLEMADVEGYPIIEQELRRSAVTAPCILIDTLLQISLEKGRHSMNQMQRTTPPRSALQFIGCTKLPNSFDPELGRMIGTVICGHCEDPSGPCDSKVLWDAYSTNTVPKEVAHKIDHLQQHIERYHIDIVASFHAGWPRLPPLLQDPWLRPRRDTNVEVWRSWAHYAYLKGRERRFMNVADDGDPRDVVEVIADEMEHEGVLYGLPREDNVCGALDFLSDVEYDLKDAPLKLHIASNVVERFLEKAKASLKEYVEKEGVGILRPFMEGRAKITFNVEEVE